MTDMVRKTKKLIMYIKEIILLILLYPLAKVIYLNEKLYLFSERGHEARDNGYYMFRYFRENHPEIKAAYIIDKQSEDLINVKNYSEIIYFGTIKHRIAFYGATCCVSTHIYGYTPNIDFYSKLFKRGFFSNKKIVSLKHGITKDDIPNLYAENTRLDLLIAAARPEYEYMLKQFHYTTDTLKYTGFARFDGLHDFKTKNQILVMPTWRNYLSTLNREEFCESEYFKCWQYFISNINLIQYIEKYDLTLIFYPHYELQKYVDCFVSVNDRVIIADKEHYDVQCLLKDSALLVTDFSSVFFDFAYMLKPSVFYQFDKEKFLNNHYNKGYFDYEKMGFGEVVYDSEALVNCVGKYIEKKFNMDSEYTKRAEDFFEIRDTQNCERIFDVIMGLK